MAVFLLFKQLFPNIWQHCSLAIAFDGVRAESEFLCSGIQRRIAVTVLHRERALGGIESSESEAEEVLPEERKRGMWRVEG